MKAWAVLCLAIACCLAPPTDAKQHRSRAAVAHFKAEHPCPANGAHRGPCPGYIVDHVRPLCVGGPDTPANMAWQTAADARRKDVLERRECRALKH
jgi:hypothetical protein